MNGKTILLTLVTVTLAIGLFAGCGNSASDTTKPDTKTAKASGEIVLYTSQPEQDAQKLIAAFNKKYPDIKVNVFRSGTEEVVSKILAEKKLGQVKADVFLVADSVTFEMLKQNDLLLPYESKELTDIPTEFVDKDYKYVGTKIISTGIMYNTKLVTSPLKSFKDLVSPNLNGSIIMPSPLYSGAAAYNVGVMSRNNSLGWNYFEGLKTNAITVDKGNGAILKAVTDGVKSAGMIVDYMAVRAKAKGASVEFVYPEEGSPIITEPVGISKDSKNAEAAKLFEDFILSSDGQNIAAQIGYTPIRKGIKAPEGLRTIEQIKNMAADASVLLQNRDADKQKFSSLFN